MFSVIIHKLDAYDLKHLKQIDTSIYYELMKKYTIFNRNYKMATILMTSCYIIGVIIDKSGLLWLQDIYLP